MSHNEIPAVNPKLAGVKAAMAFSEYLRKNIHFKQQMKRLADEQNVEGIIKSTRNVPELAPFVDTLIEVKHFELFIKQV
jgi:hypothetical protein